MKASVTNVDLISQCKDALVRFWGDTLKIEPAREGVNLALPLSRQKGSTRRSSKRQKARARITY